MIKFIKLCLTVLLLSAVVATSAAAKDPFALHQAAMENNYMGAYNLIKKGADVNELFSSEEFTPLHFAATQGSAETALLLLQKGAYANAINARGDTPLHLAAFYNSVGVAIALLQNGVDTSITDHRGWTALKIAVLAKNWMVIRLLEEK